MYKRIVVCLLAVSLLLAGCGSHGIDVNVPHNACNVTACTVPAANQPIISVH